MKELTITAFLITALLFLAILGAALIFENSRTEEIRKSLEETDVLWNDARFFSGSISNASDCGFLESENLKIGDRIYSEGLKIQNYESANKLTDALLIEKKRYALLDLQFWENSIQIRKKCGPPFSTVIYFYSQYGRTAEQETMDRVLMDFKQRCGPATVYITFPVDMGLSSIEFVKKDYNITGTPSVLINEKAVLTGVVSTDELNKYAKCW